MTVTLCQGEPCFDPDLDANGPQRDACKFIRSKWLCRYCEDEIDIIADLNVHMPAPDSSPSSILPHEKGAAEKEEQEPFVDTTYRSCYKKCYLSFNYETIYNMF